MLPHTIGALRRRRPRLTVDATDAAALATSRGPRRRRAAARRSASTRAGSTTARDAAAQRPQLKLTPPPADAAELLALYEAAW